MKEAFTSTLAIIMCLSAALSIVTDRDRGYSKAAFFMAMAVFLSQVGAT